MTVAPIAMAVRMNNWDNGLECGRVSRPICTTMDGDDGDDGDDDDDNDDDDADVTSNKCEL